MTMLVGILLLAVFLCVVVLIIRGQSPVIMLLVLAIAWAALAGIGIGEIQAKVLQGGGVAFASAVSIIVFGAWFAQILIQTGMAESVIRSAVGLAGDGPLIVAMTITLTTALLFTSMYGVGAAIAIGVIALPIMMSQGRGAGLHDGNRRRHHGEPGAVRNLPEIVSRDHLRGALADHVGD